MTMAWLFDDERTHGVEAVMARVANRGAFAPSLWRLEVANVLRGAVRRRRCDEALAGRSLARLAQMPIQTDSDTDDHAWGRIRTLSREENLTLYHAAYLELAQVHLFPLCRSLPHNNRRIRDGAPQRHLIGLASGGGVPSPTP